MLLRLQKNKAPFFFIMCILAFGCGQEPSKSEAKIAVKNSLNNFEPCSSFELEEINIDKIGLAQEENSNKWWPARVLLLDKCKVEIYDETNEPQDEKFSNQQVIHADEFFREPTSVEVHDSTLKLEFRLSKNIYDEWVANPME